MSFKSWMDYGIFVSHVTNGNRYIHDKEVKDFLASVLETGKILEVEIQKDKILWRSQLGNNLRPYDDQEYGKEPVPYPKERMKPLQYEANEGRANPKGIPYIYLASDKETAMSEVRPWHEARISLGVFKANKALKVINLCKYDIDPLSVMSFKPPSKREVVETVWSAIGGAFSRPVTRNDKLAEYVPTQIISELFKNEGYDGVTYKSSQGSGYNLVLFDIDSVDLKHCHLYEVDNISYSFKEHEYVAYSVKDE